MKFSPNLKKWILRILSYVLVAALASGVTMLFFARSAKLSRVYNIISRCYIGDVDTVKMGDAAASAMIASLGDRWSYYIPAARYDAYQEGKTNSYVGIGITIIAREDGTGFDILQVEPGSSAQEAGIMPGDILVEADGQTLAGMDVEGPAGIIKGERGTKVTVAVLRDGEKLTFEVTRRVVKTAVAKGKMLPGNIGYIRIANFNDNCAKQTIEHIDTLLEQGATALVFDVRYNSGGYVTEMVEILDHLLPEGLLFQSERYNGQSLDYDSDADCVELPMAVLVNADSYSAAEFFAAALSEYEWAVTVGQQTSGKSYFQNTFDLRDGSAIGLSVGKYLTPKGVSLAEAGGLTPDIQVDVDEQTAALIYAELADPEEDPQLQAAVAALEEKGQNG